jgi:Uma2 family endonuclease
MNVVLPTHMTVDEFLAWAVRQETGRYELLEGRVIKQAPQNWGHVETRGNVYRALLAALARAGTSFFAAPSGMTVRISNATAFEPDALVAPLPFPDDDAMEIPNPVLVVEVLSPSSVKRDLADKLVGYFKVASIQHYLVLDPEECEVIWHRRAAGGALEQPLTLREGSFTIDPPGIEITLGNIFPADGSS